MKNALDRERGPADEVTFYTVSDKRFFIGAVGLINSLRLMGHEQRIVILDRGLTEHQRELLHRECDLVTLPETWATSPSSFKPYANLLHPKGTVAIIDSDIIVTRPLDPVLEAAMSGQVCVCADPESERWFAEWEQIFALSRPLRHQTYVNAGFVAFSVEHWPELLPRWWESCQRIWSHPTVYQGADGPTSQMDQDPLNAILMSEVPAESVTVLPREAQPENNETLRHHVDLLDAGRLSCSLRGKPVTLVHFTGKAKPWERPGWYWGDRHPYPALLRRLVVGRDVRVRVPRDGAPVLWFRPGPFGASAMRVLYLANRVRTRLHGWRLLRLVYALLRGLSGNARR